MAVAVLLTTTGAQREKTTGGTLFCDDTFAFAEFPVEWQIQQMLPVDTGDIAKLPLGLNEEIAGVNRAIVFHHKILTAIIADAANIGNAINHFCQD